MEREYRRKPSKMHILFWELRRTWPGWPGEVHFSTRDFRSEMAVSETGHGPMEFWSSLESRSGLGEGRMVSKVHVWRKGRVSYWECSFGTDVLERFDHVGD